MANFRISGSIRLTETPDGAVVLDIRRGEISSVNLAGARIIRLIEGGLDQAGITDQISRDFGAEKAVVERDVKDFIDVLLERSILSTSPPSSVT